MLSPLSIGLSRLSVCKECDATRCQREGRPLKREEPEYFQHITGLVSKYICSTVPEYNFLCYLIPIFHYTSQAKYFHFSIYWTPSYIHKLTFHKHVIDLENTMHRWRIN